MYASEVPDLALVNIGCTTVYMPRSCHLVSFFQRGREHWGACLPCQIVPWFQPAIIYVGNRLPTYLVVTHVGIGYEVRRYLQSSLCGWLAG